MENRGPVDPDEMLERLEALEKRVAALEGTAPLGEAPSQEGAKDDTNSPDGLWVVEVLRRRKGAPFDTEDARGSLLYAGSVFTRGIGTLVWQIEQPVPGVLDYDWTGASHLLAALAHPVRLEIIRRLLQGARTSQDLQEIDESGTTGRLYHHLRDLLASGVIVSPRRNFYAIPPQKVITCLIIVAAAAELSTWSADDDVNDGDSGAPQGAEKNETDLQ